MANISLALSGSGFKFPAHLGALRAVMDSDHELVEISGTSGGGVVAAMWACDMSMNDMTYIALEKDWSEYMKVQPMSLFKGGLNSGDKILKFCDEISEGRTFSQVKKRVSVVSTDLLTNEPYIFNAHDTPSVKLSDAVRASISIPVLFAPHRFENKLLVDGVVSNSLPMNHLFYEDSIKVGFRITNTGPEYPYISLDSGPFDIARRSLFHLIDKRDDWTLQAGHFGKLVSIETVYAAGLHPNLPREVRVQLMHDGYNAMAKELESIES